MMLMVELNLFKVLSISSAFFSTNMDENGTVAV